MSLSRKPQVTWYGWDGDRLTTIQNDRSRIQTIYQPGSFTPLIRVTGWMSLSRKPQVTWYGWDGDRLTTIQNDRSRIQTIYQPGSFTPLIRVETATGELAKTQRRSLADALQQSGGEDGGRVVFPPVLVQMRDRLESEILADRGE